MTGRKTHEQQIRTLERKPDLPDGRETEAALHDGSAESERHRQPQRSARASEFPVSRAGMNQESRDHSKHNRPVRPVTRGRRRAPAGDRARSPLAQGARVPAEVGPDFF